MNAILAIIADGRQAIIIIDRGGVEIKYFLLNRLTAIRVLA
jgi:hypothetical protein